MTLSKRLAKRLEAAIVHDLMGTKPKRRRKKRPKSEQLVLTPNPREAGR